MPVNHKILLAMLPLLICLTGCGAVQIINESPESWGKSAGEYASLEWVSNNGRGNLPTSDSTAMYCITISDEGQKEYDWTYEQHLSSVDACIEAFVKGLS
jgi:hypothetical protein